MEKFIVEIGKLVPRWIQSLELRKSEMRCNVKTEFVPDFLCFLKQHTNTQFQQLIDLSAVDFPTKSKRFEVVYILLSIEYNCRLIVKTQVDEITFLKSVTKLFPCAEWFEREVWDMFGVFFLEHPDARRILSDYGFQGHALRKDFPLTGYVELRYDDSEKRVVTEQIQVSQEFRLFQFSTPWETINS